MRDAGQERPETREQGPGTETVKPPRDRLSPSVKHLEDKQKIKSELIETRVQTESDSKHGEESE